MNHLQYSKSKYLLQHADNPVDWYPWSEQPFDIAKKENKPVLVSIGYAACHWCHVMAKESFENKEVAGFMNRHFINIKIDKEEHPDVGYFYMDALQSLSGKGGWPLNMFVTPEKRPFYGGTYFPPTPSYGRSSWLDLLKTVEETWRKMPEDISQQSEQMMTYLEQVSKVGSFNQVFSEIRPQTNTEICRNLLKNADKKWGGFGETPKFPSSFSIKYLLDYFHIRQQQGKTEGLAEEALHHAAFSLDKMLSGGIYDQVGGGFFRYATDSEWMLPHFEKMLYDNALMISLLSTAYRITGKKRYERALRETLTFCNRELKHPGLPGFYCSLDADSEDKEGGYYIWSPQEWQKALPDAHPAINAYYGMDSNQEEGYEHPLLVVKSEKEIKDKFNLSDKQWETLRVCSREKLLGFRMARSQPEVDDKILLSWNALMNLALQEAGIALKDEAYLEQADQHLNWLEESFQSADGHWQRVYKEGQAYIDAKLEDYAYLIKAMISLGEFIGDNKRIECAEALTREVIYFFSSEKSDFFYFSASTQKDIPVRKIEIYDGAQPSANAVMVENLLKLSECLAEEQWRLRANRMLSVISPSVQKYARSFAYWAGLIQSSNRI